MPSWTRQESDRLAAKDPDLADRLHGVGLPQFLAGAPELDRRVTNATPDQLAVLALTADWRRIGMRRDITRDTIDALAVDCLPGVHDTDLSERVKIALDDLCKAVNSDISPLRRAEHGYRLSDHLLDSEKVKETDCPALFDTALGQAGDDEAFFLGLFAYSHDQIDRAKKAWLKAAANDDTDAMNNLGILLKEQGNTTEAQTWYKKAADNGDPDAMCLLAHHGGLERAEALEWIRRSREAGFDCHDLPADEEQADQTPPSYGN